MLEEGYSVDRFIQSYSPNEGPASFVSFYVTNKFINHGKPKFSYFPVCFKETKGIYPHVPLFRNWSFPGNRARILGIMLIAVIDLDECIQL